MNVLKTTVREVFFNISVCFIVLNNKEVIDDNFGPFLVLFSNNKGDVRCGVKYWI